MKSLFLLLTSLFTTIFRPLPLVSPSSAYTPSVTPIPTAVPTSVPHAVIGLVGDLGLGRHITSTARAKNNFNWSFEGIAPWLFQNDLTYANLESPIIDNCPLGLTGTFTFCGDARFLPFLQQYKLILTLANNHMLNYGASGLTQTKNYLSRFQIPFVYSSTPDSEFSQQTINGVKIGYLGFDFITNPQQNKNTILALVHKYDPQVDWLIVALHWGNEYLPQPEKWRLDFAHQLIDAGADIIHGHHPHVWQGSEDYHGKKIYYSLGNFIFDQSWSSETSHSTIVRLTLSKTEILAENLFPITIKSNSQPWLTSPTPSVGY